MNKKPKIKNIFLILLATILLFSLFLTGCGGDGKTPCNGPRYAGGAENEYGACINECDAPGICDRTHPGGRGPGCGAGQVCNADCECLTIDADLDGYPMNLSTVGLDEPQIKYNKEDCDDFNPYIHPGAEEVCDNADNDCDGLIDEDDVCGRNIYICKTDKFVGDTSSSSEIKQGYCSDGAWCQAEVVGEKGSCDYITTTEDVGKQEFFAYVCDNYGCYKFTQGLFMVCQSGYLCEPECTKDACNSTAKAWCDESNMWQTEGYCQSTCKDDSCEGVACTAGDCNSTTQQWCDQNGTWQTTGYCQSTCGTTDATCTNNGTCTAGDCNSTTQQWCDQNGTWQTTGYCNSTCRDNSCDPQCVPGQCNSETKEWCDENGTLKTEGWCSSECGKSDSTCATCSTGSCDMDAQKWCNNGYWTEEGYCNCNVCGEKDSACSECSTCEENVCDTVNDKYCENGTWKSDTYCLQCCQKDYSCYADDYCSTCTEGYCDTKDNLYCYSNQWLSEGYCDNCKPYDSGCGTQGCNNGVCDTQTKLYCENNLWKDLEERYCYLQYCGSQDTSCDCTNSADNCCENTDDGVCDPDCYQDVDPDCGNCTSSANDCCDDTSDGVCDTDCVAGVDPDCQTNCGLDSDDCCSNLDDNNCDPDCTENSDPNCEGLCTASSGDCCNPTDDNICDQDCISSIDPDCGFQYCEEDWVCEEWDVECDSIEESHTCLAWSDQNDCDTYDNMPEDTQDCHKEFPCQADDDMDQDGYPSRACYDVEYNIILTEIDCDDDNPDQHPGAEEVCNGKDDNCDDSTDEDCPCQDGTQTCGKNKGECKQGIQVCIDGRWSMCGGSGYIGPIEEECEDGADNNCDGYIDENCNCVEEETKECGSNAGICEKGWQICYNGTFGSFCNDEIEGTSEICDNNLDDDCDNYMDGDDSNCQVENPVTGGKTSCSNRKQDNDEEGVDCGGSCPTTCKEKPAACDYGKILDKCVCGKAAYRTGYCCNGKYSIIPCAQEATDTDGDGCLDDKELQMGTDMYNEDTDSDGLLDCNSREKLPLCNEDGICDSELSYPETIENCAPDCTEKEGIGLTTWILLILLILALLAIVLYLYAKSKGKKITDFFKLKGKKKNGKPELFDYLKKGSSKNAQKKERNITKLRTFVSQSLKKGRTKLQIRQAAVKSGWRPEEIDKALKGKDSRYKLFK